MGDSTPVRSNLAAPCSIGRCDLCLRESLSGPGRSKRLESTRRCWTTPVSVLDSAQSWACAVGAQGIIRLGTVVPGHRRLGVWLLGSIHHRGDRPWPADDAVLCTIPSGGSAPAHLLARALGTCWDGDWLPADALSMAALAILSDLPVAVHSDARKPVPFPGRMPPPSRLAAFPPRRWRGLIGTICQVAFMVRSPRSPHHLLLVFVLCGLLPQNGQHL